MKFDTRKDTVLNKDTPNDGCFQHENRFVPEEKEESQGLGRGIYYMANLFFTPVLASERLERHSPVVSSEGVDELTATLQGLTLESPKKTSPGKNSDATPAKKKGMSPSLCKFLKETPEAADPTLGRCRQSFVDTNKLEIVEVKRSLRLK